MQPVFGYIITIIMIFSASQLYASTGKNQPPPLYVKNDIAGLVAKGLYPNVTIVKKKADDGWRLSVESHHTTVVNGETYNIYVWNEYDNPDAATNKERYYFGGVVIFKGKKTNSSTGKLTGKNDDTANLQIQKVIKINNAINIIGTSSIDSGGNEESFIHIYLFKNDTLSIARTIQAGESNLMASGTFHRETDITYKDINGDSVEDLILTKKNYEIKDYEKSSKFKVQSRQEFIIRDNYK